MRREEGEFNGYLPDLTRGLRGMGSRIRIKRAGQKR